MGASSQCEVGQIMLWLGDKANLAQCVTELIVKREQGTGHVVHAQHCQPIGPKLWPVQNQFK